jgi:hypothetical protein
MLGVIRPGEQHKRRAGERPLSGMRNELAYFGFGSESAIAEN